MDGVNAKSMSRQRLVVQTREKMRNLVQFKGMNDDEFNEYYLQHFEESLPALPLEEIEPKIIAKIKEFENDYDLSELKVNDRLVLRQLVQAMISLESLEEIFTSERQDISDSNILLLDRLAGIMSKLRADISAMQNDLKLTRRVRLESQEETFISFMEIMKKKANQFYKDKMLYVFCPKCQFLLATTWLLYSDGDNTLKLDCKNENCKHKFEVKLAGLYKTHNKNLQDVVIP